MADTSDAPPPSNTKETTKLTNTDEQKRSPWRLRGTYLVIYGAVLLVLVVVAVLIHIHLKRASVQPHIVFIIADDMGWSDVSWRDPDMRTPTLEALLQDGVLINESYVHPLDGPSRAAMFAGLYAFHMGLQHEKMRPYAPAFVPENVTLLPQYLKALGYSTHYVGKWHLGFCNVRYTPTHRGFDSFYGTYVDGLDYYTHKDAFGHYDFRHNEDLVPPEEIEGRYLTELLSDWAVQLIANYNDTDVPLFVVLAYHAVHSPLQAPDEYEETCEHIDNPDRRMVCAMAAAMDDGIRNVTEALRSRGMLDSTVFIFTSDNGGVPGHGSSNAPLNGAHGQLYEGGTRVPTFVSGGRFLDYPGSTYEGPFQQVDWVPTIVSMAKGDPVPIMLETDGLNHWHQIRGGDPSPRTEIVYSVDDYFEDHVHVGGIRVGQYKLIHGPMANLTTQDLDLSMHTQLFDLDNDPREHVNLAHDLPEVTERLLSRIGELRKTLVKAVNAERESNSNPDNYGGAWSPGWC